MPRRNAFILFGLFGLCLVAWLAVQGSATAPRGPLRYLKGFPGHHEDYENLSLLIDVMQHLDQNYVHELTKEEKRRFIEEAIDSGLHSLDEHTAFLPPREYKAFEKQNKQSFGGIGINLNLGRETGRLTVVSPILGSPAYQAGVKPGDMIEKINGESTEGMTSDEAVEKITGKIGEKVTLTLRSRGSLRTRDVSLVRAQIEVDSVQGDQRDGKNRWDFMLDKSDRIGYVRLSGFGRKSVDEMKAALTQLKEQGVRGLVLDLRGNPGGSLQAAVAISNMFMNHGRIVSVEGRSRAPEIYDAKPEDTMLPAAGHPMVILVDRDSASASEIVAAALQDAGRAVVMGERSFGKGSVQSLIEMENGQSAVKITIAKYLRPSGKNIHRFPKMKEEDVWGVKPNVEVPQTLTEKLDYWLARRDRDVLRQNPSAEDARERALDLAGPLASAWLAISPAGSPFLIAELAAALDRQPTPPRTFQDKVLNQAIEYLKRAQAAEQTTRRG